MIDEGERDGSSIKAVDDREEDEGESEVAETAAQHSEDSPGHTRDATQRSNTEDNVAEHSADSEPDSDLEETGDKTPRLPAGGGTRTDPLVDATAIPTELATDEPGGGSVPVST